MPYLILAKTEGVGMVDPNGQLYVTDQNCTFEGTAMVNNDLIITGRSNSDGYIASVKTDGTGTINWQKTISDVWLYNVETDASGNVYACGSGPTFGEGGLLMKINAGGGSVAWTKSWDNEVAGSSVNNNLVLDSGGNVIVVGVDSSPTNRRGIVRKYSNSGTLIWEKYLIAAAQTPYGNHVAVDSSDNIYVSFFNHAYQKFIAKYNSSGALQWRKEIVFAGGSNERTFGVKVAPSGALYVSGSTTISSDRDALLTKLDTDGNFTWSRRVGNATTNEDGGTTANGRMNLVLDDSENIYYTLTGDNAPGSSRDRSLIFKYNSSGSIQWQRALERAGTFEVEGYSMVLAGNVYLLVGRLTGISRGFVFKAPIDGTDTGTYGDYTYADPSFTEAASPAQTITERTEFTEGTSSYTETSPTLTLDAVTNTFTVYNKT